MGRESFDGQESGGGISNFDFTVTKAWFGPSPGLSEQGYTHDSGAEIQFLHLAGTTDLEDRPVLDEDGFHPSFKLKEGWEPTNGGQSVEFNGSGKPVFGSYAGKFLATALKLTESVADTPEDPLGGNNQKEDASVWVGTRWHMDEVEIVWGGSFDPTQHLMPTAYLGKGAVSGNAAAPAAATAPSTDTNAIREQLKEMARNMSYSDWQPLALKVEGVTSNSDLLKEVADEAKLYAEANA